MRKNGNEIQEIKNNDVLLIKNIATSDLNETAKDEAMKRLMNHNEEEDGLMDKIFGKKHPDIYVTMIICLVLAIVGIVCTIAFKNNVDFVKYMWGILIPAITGCAGYMFGAKKK